MILVTEIVGQSRWIYFVCKWSAYCITCVTRWKCPVHHILFKRCKLDAKDAKAAKINTPNIPYKLKDCISPVFFFKFSLYLAFMSWTFWPRYTNKYVTRSREMSHMSKMFNFEFLTPLSGNLKMFNFDAYPIRIGYLVTDLWAIYQGWKHYETKRF